MTSRVKAIDPGFSTADGDFPTLDYDENQYLRFCFYDWRDETVVVLFREVVAFQWHAVEELLPGEPFDGSCEVLESSWLEKHRAQGLVEAGKVHHYKFNLNACGSLEVLCTGFRLENQQKNNGSFWNK